MSGRRLKQFCFYALRALCMNFSKKAPDTVRAVPGLFFLTKLRKFFVYFLSISLYFQASGIENLSSPTLSLNVILKPALRVPNLGSFMFT